MASRPFGAVFLMWVGGQVTVPLSAAKSEVSGYTEPATFTFGPQGARIASASVSSEMNWSGFREICGTKTLFLLHRSEDPAIVLPKRFFASAAQMQAWKELVASQTNCRPIRPRGIAARWC
jgi:hypothetical protein